MPSWRFPFARTVWEKLRADRVEREQRTQRAVRVAHRWFHCGLCERTGHGGSLEDHLAECPVLAETVRDVEQFLAR
jgi:hypothetical protein